MRPELFALIAASAVALVGCSAGETPAPQPTPSVASTPSVDVAESPSAQAATEEIEEAYIAEYKQLAGNVDLYPEEKLVEIGYEACELMEDGKTVPHDFTGDKQGDRSVGIPAGMAAQVTLCPEATN